MQPSTRAPGYDLFKLFVAIILLILFLLLSWGQAPQTAIPASESHTSTALSPNENTISTSTIARAASPSLTPTVAVNPPSSAQDTLPAITSTVAVIPRSSPTGTNTPSPTNTSAITPTPLPSPTIAPVVELTATPIAAVPPSMDVCEAANSRARLGAGMNATILRRLNFRSSPGIRDNWLLTNTPGTKVEVVGGPECLSHFTGAYLWWQIQLPDGRIGWSAEGSLHGSFYFMEPVE